MIRRMLDLTHKMWVYLLATLERPQELPAVIWLTTVRRVHLGELLILNRHKAWLKAAGIRTVIDVGAHKGEFASAVRVLLPEAQIYSFEPLKDCYQALSSHLGRYGKFQAFCVALGHQRGEVPFWRSRFTKSSSALPMSDLHRTAFPWTANNTSLTVQMQMLDDYAGKMHLVREVLLKVDVQGYELRVLEGGLQVLPYVDYVIVESSFEPLYECQASFHDVYQFLTRRGFEYAGNLDQLLSPLDQTILQVDALFVRKS